MAPPLAGVSQVGGGGWTALPFAVIRAILPGTVLPLRQIPTIGGHGYVDDRAKETPGAVTVAVSPALSLHDGRGGEGPDPLDLRTGRVVSQLPRNSRIRTHGNSPTT